jgi:hypothetical protein
VLQPDDVKELHNIRPVLLLNFLKSQTAAYTGWHPFVVGDDVLIRPDEMDEFKDGFWLGRLVDTPPPDPDDPDDIRQGGCLHRRALVRKKANLSAKEAPVVSGKCLKYSTSRRGHGFQSGLMCDSGPEVNYNSSHQSE